ncbi:hypothetical protein N825_17670 [Skermanella stibiiresistens SB22]|uniref:Uncharacterized protein n=1 Tax=Skermanella stibiiresistens SB22 TaxID=1385369 RepID=W9GUG4_9PROT|nr:hypothetical protein [Skermanella stibiiresistens]EWY37439.1 hypothetical protein N825_17670 [Skermanella stibiiresistens SB22]
MFRHVAMAGEPGEGPSARIDAAAARAALTKDRVAIIRDALRRMLADEEQVKRVARASGDLLRR